MEGKGGRGYDRIMDRQAVSCTSPIFSNEIPLSIPHEQRNRVEMNRASSNHHKYSSSDSRRSRQLPYLARTHWSKNSHSSSRTHNMWMMRT